MLVSEDVEVRLADAQLEPLLSDYLARGGLKQDEPRLTDVLIRGKRANAILRMERYYVSPLDQSYHLSAITGTAMLVQVGIVHALVLGRRERKDVEVYLSDYHISLKRQLTDPLKVRIQLDLVNRIVLPAGHQSSTPRTFHRWQFAVDDDAWVGTLTLAFPF